MGHRHAISDAGWGRIEHLLPGRPGDPGWTSADNRLFIDAVVYVAKTGIPWRDLPVRFGKWDTAFKRFSRWAAKGTWRRVFEALQDPDLEWMIMDSTVVRAHAHAAVFRHGQRLPAHPHPSHAFEHEGAAQGSPRRATLGWMTQSRWDWFAGVTDDNLRGMFRIAGNTISPSRRDWEAES